MKNKAKEIEMPISKIYDMAVQVQNISHEIYSRNSKEIGNAVLFHKYFPKTVLQDFRSCLKNEFIFVTPKNLYISIEKQKYPNMYNLSLYGYVFVEGRNVRVNIDTFKMETPEPSKFVMKTEVAPHVNEFLKELEKNIHKHIFDLDINNVRKRRELIKQILS